MHLHTVVDVVGLTALTTLNVGLWTLRVALAAAGRRVLAAVVASVEAVLFSLAFGTVVEALDDPVRIAAYAVGVGAGTLLGIAVDAWHVDRTRTRRAPTAPTSPAPLPAPDRTVYGGSAERPRATRAAHEGVLP